VIGKQVTALVEDRRLAVRWFPVRDSADLVDMAGADAARRQFGGDLLSDAPCTWLQNFRERLVSERPRPVATHDAREAAFTPRAELQAPLLDELAELDDATFRARFSGTAVKRIGRDRFQRNVAYALGNSAAPATALPAVERLLTDASPLVRGAAVWALSQLTPPAEFAALAQATTETERTRLLEDFAAKLADHAKKLGGKEYWNQYKPSPEFVVLFLPSEALFSTALQVDPLLIENAWGQKVVIATPTTLLSVLRTIAHSWDRVEVEQRAEKVIELAEKLHDGVRIASDHFADAGGSLNKAVKEYNQTLETLRSRVYNNAEKLITEGEKMKAERQLADGATIDIQAHETLPEVKRPRKGAKELPGDEAAPSA
jgi:ClpP class serine protease